MDWDEQNPRPAVRAATLGENLETLSISELEARLVSLTREMERVSAEIEAKRKHEAAAAAVFKR
jgi:uncharacterized small protein (DUF1192 family)